MSLLTVPSVTHANHSSHGFYGHKTFFKNFFSSLEANTLHHAWLLTGPQGIGKARAAKILAQFLLEYPSPPYPSSIPLSAPLWTKTQQEMNPDFLLIEKGEETLSQSKNFITIDAVRHMSHVVQQTSREDGWKVIIVDSVDEMNEKAQNALLKNLEEPSSKTVFFLINHTASTLSPTVRSRCQEVKLHPLSSLDMENFVNDQNLTFQERDKNTLLQIAEGRLGIFQTMVQHNGLGTLDKIIEGFHEVLSLKTPPYPLCLRLSETLLKEGDHAYPLFSYLLAWYSHRITYRMAVQDFSNPLNEKEKNLFSLLSPLSMEKWLTVQEKILESMKEESVLKVEQKQTILNCFMALEKAL